MSDFTLQERQAFYLQTTGMKEKIMKCTSDNKLDKNYSIVDIGGRRNERKKWIHTCGDVQHFIYVADLMNYKLVLSEDANTNRLSEDLKLIDCLLRNELFKDSIHIFCMTRNQFLILLKIFRTKNFKDRLALLVISFNIFLIHIYLHIEVTILSFLHL